MTPIRVRAPLDAVVSLDDLKAHLRVSGDDSDVIIDQLEREVVSQLDGYRGILGRCILSQDWTVTFDRPGTHRLPFPDVTSVSVDAGEAALHHDALGSLVALTEPATVTITAEMPEDALEAVRGAIKIKVKARYDNLSGPEFEAAERAFNSMIQHLRWVRV